MRFSASSIGIPLSVSVPRPASLAWVGSHSAAASSSGKSTIPTASYCPYLREVVQLAASVVEGLRSGFLLCFCPFSWLNSCKTM